MVYLSRAAFNEAATAIRRAAAARKQKRDEKRTLLPWGVKPTKIRKALKRTRISQVSDKGAIKAEIVRLLGLLDMKKNGKLCRFHKDHPGDTACHIVPQQRGDAARFDPENVY